MVNYLDLSFTEFLIEENGNREAYYEAKYKVEASYKEETIGYFYYDITLSRSDKIRDIILSYVEVNLNQRNKGFGNLLLRKFGEIYTNKYNGWPIHAMFEHPGAEAAFNNAVSNGWIPKKILGKSFLLNIYEESLVRV